MLFGVSGGPDSICLVDILNKANYNIVVAHVNHMIRDEADEDEEFVKRYCKERNIIFESKKVDVQTLARKERIGTEEAGRKARYKFFEEVLKKYDCTKIATAHTKNDNSETILMNLIRGTGGAGLKGIQPLRDRIFIKPLIKVSREEIEKYCDSHNLNPKYDKTNNENIYTRNKVRNILIPLIQNEFNPNIIDTLDRLSEVMTVENEFIQEIVEEKYKELLIKEEKEEIILNLKEFNKLHEAIKTKIVFYTIKRCLGNINGVSKIHVDDIIELCKKNIGNKYLTPNKNIKILVNKGKMYFFVTKIS